MIGSDYQASEISDSPRFVPLSWHRGRDRISHFRDESAGKKGSLGIPIPYLVSILGSHWRISEVVYGRRAIRKAQAKALGEFLKVSPELSI